METLELSVKWEKHSTRTLSLVIHRVKLKKTCKKYISIQQGMKLRKLSILVVNWVSSCLSFFLSASTAATYIFTAPNGTTTIITLELCALNAEFQHFILRLIKMSLLWKYHSKRFPGDSGWKEAQRQGEDRITLQITLINVQITRKHGHWKMKES